MSLVKGSGTPVAILKNTYSIVEAVRLVEVE